MEPLEVRWMHTGAKHLSLPTAPITAAETAYKAFSMDESDRIEAEWEKLSKKTQAKIVREWGRGDGEWSLKERSVGTKAKGEDNEQAIKEADEADDPPTPAASEASLPDSPEDKAEVYKSIIERTRTDPTQLDQVHGVPVSQDSLFEVDLDTLSLHPVFWPQSGPRVPVLRGTWYVENETRPCAWDLAAELEKAYQKVQPWQPAYKDELYAARVLAANGDEKLKQELPKRFGDGVAVVFEDAVRGRLITSGALDVLSRAIWSSFGETTGSYIYRGYTAAAASRAPVPVVPMAPVTENSGPPEATAKSLAKSGHSTPELEEPENGKNKKAQWPKSPTEFFARAKKEIEARQKSMEEQNAPITRSHNDDEPCTDLVLVIHGIGQHLAAQYESFNFIYAANQFRQVLRKQSDEPSISSVMRDRRCQVLPVQWRASLNLESGSSEEDAEKEESNTFTFADITIGKSIPYVREVTNSVLLDIPLFMSDHRRKMIEAVCQQANKLYRMWIARHPDFEKHGRVHIVGHSLGSALAAHILSNQPTTVPRLSDLPMAALEQATDRFIFNTSNLFLCGSPLGIFLGLRQSHIIARSGRERTMNAAPDEAELHPGNFGCMAIDSVYNIFYYTDPVAYALNATVDVRVAKKRPPLAIPSVTGSLFPSVALPPMPTMPALPTLPSISGVKKYLPFGGPSSTKREPGSKDQKTPESEEVELITEDERLAGTRGERRFAALNPRGSVDFFLPSSGVNDYVDMITAHSNYWADPNFSAFILNETFATPEDDARTGRAPEEPKE
ncbi:hypothetical protein CC85DRAFT_247655 [Cutaneotrichosporon oleaginosum]|uniref:DDHD domain-containing protein n=1 Tax=Cutaneotrichosporon oleaginosum TaxID=879819 RepID=A0A0J0XK60_9TREE|nr:uncharacterized protein CC85DRAFT_247655 [Cutaneotrichosporon oleaginosum]KLT41457.1 hypothetical protein CC85DRAFT_247655 [Cutaneotrichosporon oleaginosum]TXT12217.1 hypothetical protein COLE_02627 [Cutaneotrichosporon oleaginosum]